MTTKKNSEQRKREFRQVPVRELRVKRADSGAITIDGYAAVFNSLSEDLGGFREQILPGAFTGCLKNEPDVRCLFNHNESRILGRTKSGTLTLDEDDRGLHYACDLPDTQYARDLATSIERGDIDQCSFGFYCLDDDWAMMDETPVRSVKSAELFDVSPVTYPAYPDTEVSMRSAFPDGKVVIPAGLKRGKRNESCDCDCPECKDGDCAECSNEQCDDPNCECALRSLRCRMRLAQEF
jgi:hypothetical protein